MKRTMLPVLLLTIAATALAAAATTPTTVTVRTAKVKGTMESILANAKGMTLYYFTKDGPGDATCTGGCAQLWMPALLPQGKPTGPNGIAAGLKAFKGADGRQVEYHGHPLYTYAKDRKPGQVNGSGVFPTWHVATPKLASGGSTGPSTSSTGTTYGGGY